MFENNNITEDENESNSSKVNSYLNSIFGMTNSNEKKPTPAPMIGKKNSKLVSANVTNDKIWIYKNGKLI